MRGDSGRLCNLRIDSAMCVCVFGFCAYGFCMHILSSLCYFFLYPPR